jgi:predicted Zn-dependent peptidase
VVDLIQDKFRQIRDEPVDPKDLKRTKEQLKGNLLLGLESTSSRMTRLGKMYMYHNRCFGLEEIIQGIEEVTPERLQQLTHSLLDPDALRGPRSCGWPPHIPFCHGWKGLSDDSSL